jgi:predicted signal transduction protein with EAL and GGDEF domain
MTATDRLITASIGVAVIPTMALDKESLISAADIILYRSRVAVAGRGE